MDQSIGSPRRTLGRWYLVFRYRQRKIARRLGNVQRFFSSVMSSMKRHTYSSRLSESKLYCGITLSGDVHQRTVAAPDDSDADAHQDEGRQSHHHVGALLAE